MSEDLFSERRMVRWKESLRGMLRIVIHTFRLWWTWTIQNMMIRSRLECRKNWRFCFQTLSRNADTEPSVCGAFGFASSTMWWDFIIPYWVVQMPSTWWAISWIPMVEVHSSRSSTTSGVADHGSIFDICFSCHAKASRPKTHSFPCGYSTGAAVVSFVCIHLAIRLVLFLICV